MFSIRDNMLRACNQPDGNYYTTEISKMIHIGASHHPAPEKVLNIQAHSRSSHLPPGQSHQEGGPTSTSQWAWLLETVMGSGKITQSKQGQLGVSGEEFNVNNGRIMTSLSLRLQPGGTFKPGASGESSCGGNLSEKQKPHKRKPEWERWGGGEEGVSCDIIRAPWSSCTWN